LARRSNEKQRTGPDRQNRDTDPRAPETIAPLGRDRLPQRFYVCDKRLIPGSSEVVQAMGTEGIAKITANFHQIEVLEETDKSQLGRRRVFNGQSRQPRPFCQLIDF